MLRVLQYYASLLLYAAKARPKLFHILWNNKFESFDRTLLLLFYRMLGKRLAFTAHNVNAGQRDGNDSWLNRMTLRMQYGLVDHIFVHTGQMKRELISEFGVLESKISVIPFGINNTVPDSELTTAQARRKLGLGAGDKALLFFGNIAPYKGLEYLVSAFEKIAKAEASYRLIIAGRPKGCEDYWKQIQDAIARSGVRERIIQRIGYVPDNETELYFKAADVLVLPYSHIFQSGVLFLGYSFGLPVIAADVGSLKEEIIEGKTGFVCRPQDPSDLGDTIVRYFTSNLFSERESRRREIKAYANERYSWNKVATVTTRVYSKLLES
jgi:glycosyltransferase involved in cell wall biosynthesis